MTRQPKVVVDEVVLLSYPQALVRAIDKIHNAYFDGKASAAHNIIMALLNEVYPLVQEDVRRMIDHIDMAEGYYYSLLQEMIPHYARADRDVDKIYKELLSEGQALFDMARLRVISIAFRRLGLTGNVEERGALKMGDSRSILNHLSRLVSILKSFSKNIDEDKIEFVKKELEEAFNVDLRVSYDDEGE